MELTKKYLLALFACAAVIAACIIGASHQMHEKELSASYASMQEILQQPLTTSETIEYGKSFNSELYENSNVNVEFTSQINSKRLGEQQLTYTATMTDEFNQTASVNQAVTVNVVDTKPAEITLVKDTVSIYENGTVDFYENIESVIDEADGEIPVTDCEIETDLDETTVGEYPVTVKVKDQSGNASETSFTVQVKESSIYPYLIRINRAMNTVTVYERDMDGEYTVPIKAMVCSTGAATPLGTYRTSGKYRWRALFGNVYGQYAQTIVGDILFHSVPYYSTNPGDLESEEYNKLGTAASMGCIRLCVQDVKWLYDYCPSGTTVVLYDDYESAGPLGKPTSIQIDPYGENAGWDPTDDDPNNPWHQTYGG